MLISESQHFLTKRLLLSLYYQRLAFWVSVPLLLGRTAGLTVLLSHHLFTSYGPQSPTLCYCFGAYFGAYTSTLD